MGRRSFIITAIAILVAFLGWFNRYEFVRIYYMHQYYKGTPEKLIKTHEKEFMEDREILGRYPLFYPSAGTKDAGPYLNPRLHWEIGEIHSQGDLTLPPFLHKEMNEDWVVKKPLFKKMGMNFQWMKELEKYDFWSPEVESPAYPKDKKFQSYAYPIPTYRDLETWAKLRYLYGKETGDVQSALKEVRHLMRLIWTNDYLVSSMVVLAMLKMENQFEEILTPKEMGEWKFFSVDHLMRAKRHFYSLPTVVDVRLSDETFDKMTKTNVGICLMLHEGSMSYLMVRELLEGVLSYGYRRLQDKLQFANCRKNLYHQIWQDPKWDTIKSLEGVTIFGRQKSLEEIKQDEDLKAAVGFMLMKTAQTTTFQYGKNK